METLFTCDVCKYKITKKHLYEKHLLSKNHLKKRGEASEALVLPALPHPVNPERVKSTTNVESKVSESISTSTNKVASVTANVVAPSLADTKAAGTNVVAPSAAGANKVASVTASANVVAPSAAGTSLAGTKAAGTDTRTQNRPALEPPSSFPKPLNKALYERATSDFNKYVKDNNKENNEIFEPLKDNETTTTTTITDESGNTIIEKTTYSTTNTVTDYDVHIDKADFIMMMTKSLTTLKETGDKEAFVSNFFDYMFRHITEIRHSSVTNPPRNIMYDD